MIGGGAAGLAAAAMLSRRGLEPTVLERGPEVGWSWHGRYDRLQLHTVRWLSGLPGHPIPRRYGRWPSRERVCDYSASTPSGTGSTSAAAWRPCTSSGRTAAGGWRHIARRDRLGIPSQALGIAMTKLPPRWVNALALWLRRHTIPDLAPYGLPIPPEPPGVTFARKWMIPILDVGIVDAARGGRVVVVAAVERFEGTEVVLTDGLRLAPDAVVAGTGFRPALEPLVGHLGVLDERGRPKAAMPVPGLHVVGFTVSFGGLLRTIGIEARRLAENVAY